MGAFAEALARDVRREVLRKLSTFNRLVMQGRDVEDAAAEAGFDLTDPDVQDFIKEQRAVFQRP